MIGTKTADDRAGEDRKWEHDPNKVSIEGVLPGFVIRLPKDRKFPSDLQAECRDHFDAILRGEAVPLVDKLLEDL